MALFKNKANLIWEVADLLRGDYRQSDYGKVILPLTILRRLDCVLAPKKQKVLDTLPKVEKLSDRAKDLTLNKVAGFNFHNRSQFDFAKLIAENGETKGIGFITKLYGDFKEGEFVKILPNKHFGYHPITVEQPQKDENGNIIQSKGKPKADTKLRDYENIPFLQKGINDKLIEQGIKEYFKREVLPHLPDAWIDETKTGYEINFTKYFYEFKPLRSLDDIKADILALEESSLALEKKVLN